jgi:hypothetical protein
LLITARHTRKIITATAAASASLLFAGTSIALASTATRAHPAVRAPHGHVRQILSGMALHHTFVPAGRSTPQSEPLTDPDDITSMGRYLFTAFQNGVGSQGEPSSDGNTDSTVIEFTGSGRVLRQWDIKGKCDGLTADPLRGEVIATVNEDANSSIYTIAPWGGKVRHYTYSEPLPHFGGTDAIEIYHGRVLVSASAPGTTGAAAPQPTYPAVYVVTFHPATHIAHVSPLFYDEASATVANVGATRGTTVKLALTDPDSNEVVPFSAARFGGDFMLTSQADMEQIFVRPGRGGLHLSVLQLSQSVDDTAWTRGRSGRLYGPDASSDTIDEVTGLRPGAVIVAVTPCDAGNAPATCPAPGFPDNYLGWLNPWTGTITPVALTGPQYQPKGLVFINRGQGRRR